MVFKLIPSMLLVLACFGAELKLSVSSPSTIIASNAPNESVLTFLRSSDLVSWNPVTNFYSSNSTHSILLEKSSSAGFYLAQSLDLAPTREGFTNLIKSYGQLTTIAGAGGSTASANKWQPSFEGGPATAALLSRPHVAMEDGNGVIFLADKDAHAIRKILPNGTIVTAAGTGQPGNGPDDPTLGTTVAINEPNGLWVSGRNLCYFLDLGNGKIRKLGPNGKTHTVFSVTGGISTGRGLWVNDGETLAYVSSGTQLLKWTLTEGVTVFADGFSQLGNLAVDSEGLVHVTDRNANLVYRIEANGSKTVIAGNGLISGGGDGELATQTGLNQVRAIWFMPHGGILLGTDNGSQLWYLDKAGVIHLLLNGNSNHTHSGDGNWFYATGEQRVSKIRQITMTHGGDILMTEHDSGYIRKIKFLPFTP